jgi:hypothetical protein
MVARCQKKTSHLADKPIRPPVTWVNKHLLPDCDHTIFPGCPIAQMGFTDMRFFFGVPTFQHRWSRRARSGTFHAVFRSVSAVLTCVINRWGSHQIQCHGLKLVDLGGCSQAAPIWFPSNFSTSEEIVLKLIGSHCGTLGLAPWT